MVVTISSLMFILQSNQNECAYCNYKCFAIGHIINNIFINLDDSKCYMTTATYTIDFNRNCVHLTL